MGFELRGWPSRGAFPFIHSNSREVPVGKRCPEAGRCVGRGCEILFRASPVAWMKIQNRIKFNKGCIFFQGKRKKGSEVHGRML